MKTIAVISRKGGSGKTTLALHLAVAAEKSGKVAAVVDLDPQASAAGWGDSREADGPEVVSVQPSRLGKALEAARSNGAGFVVIDTAPHSETAALAAARVADLVLAPCRPAILDLRAVGATVDLASLAGAKLFVVLNAAPPRGSLVLEAEKALEAQGVEVAPVRISQRVAFSHALTAGQTAQEFEPGGKAASEISKLYKWICSQVNM